MSSITNQGKGTIVIVPRLGFPIRQATVPDLGSLGKRLDDRPERLSKVTGFFLEIVQDGFTGQTGVILGNPRHQQQEFPFRWVFGFIVNWIKSVLDKVYRMQVSVVHTADPEKVSVRVKHGAVPGMQLAHGICDVNGESGGSNGRDDWRWL